MKRERIDKLLVELGFAGSRAKAQAMIMAGVVLVDEQRVDKPSNIFATTSSIRIKNANDPSSRYVGRGGLKLEAAIANFQLQVDGAVCLDVGASTGGFTDCLLKHGASKVFAIDVGHNQIDYRLRTDPRVEVREGVNARYLQQEDFPVRFDLIVIDVSFISVTKILRALSPLLNDTGKLVVLIKPQFEVGRGEVGSGGIVRDPVKHARVITDVNEFTASIGFENLALMESPIHGADGNVEFLGVYRRT